MEVSNRPMVQQPQIRMNDNLLSVRPGETSQVFIKERLPENEAKVVLKGQETVVKFDGPIPGEDRTLVEVKGLNENGQITVRAINNSSAPETPNYSKSADALLNKAGINPAASPELKEAVSQILSRGGDITKETVAVLQGFLKNEPGSIEMKLNTIKIMQQKNIEFTKVQLHAVHSALNGESLTDSLSKIFDSPEPLTQTSNPRSAKTPGSIIEAVIFKIKNGEDATEALKQILSELETSQDTVDIKKSQLIQQAAKSRIIDQLPSELKGEIENETSITKIANILMNKILPDHVKIAIQEGLKLEKIGTARLLAALQNLSVPQDFQIEQADESENQQLTAIRETAKLIQKEPEISNLLQAVEKLLKEHADGEINLESLKPSLKKAEELAGRGRELAARKELASTMAEIEKTNPQLQKPSEGRALSKAEEYLINEAAQSLQLSSRNLIVTEITKKLSQMAIDFKKLRQEMSRNLDAASRLIEARQPGSSAPVRQMIDATIKNLDNAILKGNFMLYTDMATEKKILTASSRLAEAKNHLNNGNFSEANQIVKEVKGLVDKLVFKPSDTRVKHFVSEESLLGGSKKTEIPTHILAGQEKGARQIFEAIKRMGFTHENDAAQSILEKGEPPHNLKSALLQMLETGDSQYKMNAEQALAQITGQQLLNKQDSSGMANLFLQLPLMLDKQLENVNVYVNSQKKGEKVDWENCSLYFVLETKKLGEVGISVSAVNKNLSITFKNNRENLQQVMEPLKEPVKERLQEIGFHVGAIQVKPIAGENPKAEAVKTADAIPAFTEKGYDYTI